MKAFLKILGSMKTMAVLMLFFAFVLGYATFIENDYGTVTAKADVYNASWFEFLLALLAINLVLNIYNYKMFSRKKLPILIFHIAFLVILLGAAITRYVGFEGTMHIREGSASSNIISSDTYFEVKATQDKKSVSSSQGQIFLSKRSTNILKSSLELNGKDIDVHLVEYIPNVTRGIVEDTKEGKPLLNLMVSAGRKGKSVILQQGNYIDNGSYVLDFQSHKTFTKPVISIFIKNNQFFMKHNIELSYLKMDDRTQGKLPKNDMEPLAKRTLFSYNQGNFVVKGFTLHGKEVLKSNPKVSPRQIGNDALRFLVSVDKKSKLVTLFSRVGTLAKPVHTKIDGVDITLSYGSKYIHLPFSLYLVDFQLDRYPGSMSPASYASEVILIDKKKNIEQRYRIYMNHILDYQGYRFFQSSYDPDEKGTILSVNHDPGTLVTYIGYFLLMVGMFWALLFKNGRFVLLAKKVKKIADAKVVSALFGMILLGSMTPSYGAELDPTLKTILAFDKNHADKFGELIVQDNGGRMKPLDTLATEILRKIHRDSSLVVGSTSLDANQVILGMMIRPDAYKQIKFIRTKNKEINKIIGAREDAKFASFSQFFQDDMRLRGYKLAPLVEKATRKPPKYRNRFDKEVLKVDERVNVSYMVYTGELLRIWPKQNDTNNKWYATINALETFPPKEANEVRNLAITYFTDIDKALSSGDWSASDKSLQKIAKYQKFYGAEVYPSKTRIEAEIFYNKTKIFERLFPLYLLVGLVLLILSFIKIIKPTFQIDTYMKIALWLMILFFIAHTIGLINRWYISGHAPWSDGYESMIYISWSTVLAGFIFSKRSPMTMAATGVLAGIILFVAHLNWMNPQVTNLVPVLNSYWLSIHVSLITASYGFLALGALLGFITLLLFIVRDKSNEKHIVLSIKELTVINEMSLMVGLALLTVGNFLGGVWANESWGRYWGWDPKETWALVTILVYAVVIHTRFIKSLANEYVFNVISLLAFTSVLMTYFGVNYYLAGMHSYGKGDPIPIPDFVPISYAIVFAVIALAYKKRRL